MTTQNLLNVLLDATESDPLATPEAAPDKQCSLNDLLDTPESATVLDSTPRTLIRWRQEGTGPPYCKIGRKVRYRYSSLLRWVEAQEITPVRESRK
jgi:predicted DNA-binding transcriptional regulator AlpA